MIYLRWKVRYGYNTETRYSVWLRLNRFFYLPKDGRLLQSSNISSVTRMLSYVFKCFCGRLSSQCGQNKFYPFFLVGRKLLLRFQSKNADRKFIGLWLDMQGLSFNSLQLHSIFYRKLFYDNVGAEIIKNVTNDYICFFLLLVEPRQVHLRHLFDTLHMHLKQGLL